MLIECHLAESAHESLSPMIIHTRSCNASVSLTTSRWLSRGKAEVAADQRHIALVSHGMIPIVAMYQGPGKDSLADSVFCGKGEIARIHILEPC